VKARKRTIASADCGPLEHERFTSPRGGEKGVRKNVSLLKERTTGKEENGTFDEKEKRNFANLAGRRMRGTKRAQGRETGREWSSFRVVQ